MKYKNIILLYNIMINLYFIKFNIFFFFSLYIFRISIHTDIKFFNKNIKELKNLLILYNKSQSDKSEIYFSKFKLIFVFCQDKTIIHEQSNDLLNKLFDKSIDIILSNFFTIFICFNLLEFNYKSHLFYSILISFIELLFFIFLICVFSIDNLKALWNFFFDNLKVLILVDDLSNLLNKFLNQIDNNFDYHEFHKSCFVFFNKIRTLNNFFKNFEKKYTIYYFSIIERLNLLFDFHKYLPNNINTIYKHQTLIIFQQLYKCQINLQNYFNIDLKKNFFYLLIFDIYFYLFYFFDNKNINYDKILLDLQNIHESDKILLDLQNIHEYDQNFIIEKQKLILKYLLYFF